MPPGITHGVKDPARRELQGNWGNCSLASESGPPGQGSEMREQFPQKLTWLSLEAMAEKEHDARSSRPFSVPPCLRGESLEEPGSGAEPDQQQRS
jgi:hypothetical protein